MADEMKMKWRLVFLTVLLLFGMPQGALANNPPGPQAALAEILILPIMMLLSLVGGGYAVLRRVRAKKSPGRTILAVVGAILAILFSGAHEGYAVIVALIFGIIALVRGLQMISWGLEARSGEERSEYLREANPLRLIVAGSVLVPVTLLLAGMPFAFAGYWPNAHWRHRSLVEFVAYQLAYASLEESRTGERRFHKITRDDPEVGHRFQWFSMEVEYGPDGKTFTAHMPPSHVPLYPYNFLSAQPSYHADETGQIRMIYVYKKDRCPPDAPVVLQVDQDIFKALKDGDQNVRRIVAGALGKLEDPRAVKPLVAALKDKDSEVREEVARALAHLKDPRAVKPLIAALKDKDPSVREDVADALGELDDPRSIEIVVAALKDGDPNVRGGVAHALGHLKDPRAVEPLIAALKDQDVHVRRSAAHALGELKDPRAVEPLIAALKDQDVHVRRSAAHALGELKDPRAVEPLIAALIDEDSSVRSSAAYALGELKNPRAVEPLITAVKDEDHDVRWSAVIALRELGDPRAVEPLIAALKDQDAQVRGSAAYALGELKDPRAVEPLIAAVKDSNWEVSWSAEKALKSITGQNFGPYSGEWQKWWDQNKKNFQTNLSKEASR